MRAKIVLWGFLLVGQFQTFAIAENQNDTLANWTVGGHFSRSRWLESMNNIDPDKGVDRIDEFRRLLQDYDLIGLSQLQVESLLGAPEGTVRKMYPVYFAGQLEIEYDNNRVKQWRLYNVGHSGPWITTNVIWSGLRFQEYLLKSKLPASTALKEGKNGGR